MNINLTLLDQLQDEVAKKGKTTLLPQNLSLDHLDALLLWIEVYIQLRETGKEPDPWINEKLLWLLMLFVSTKELRPADEISFINDHIESLRIGLLTEVLVRAGLIERDITPTENNWLDMDAIVYRPVLGKLN